MRTGRQRQRRGAIGCALAGLLLAGTGTGACSAADDDGARADDIADDSGSDQAAGPTQPAGTEPDAVRSYVEDLLFRYDQAANAIMLDQTVTRDREADVVQEYLAIFEPDSELARQALDGWQANADEGLTIRPRVEGGQPVTTRLAGSIETVSADEVRFPTCDEHNYEILDAEGQVTEIVRIAGLPGEGGAVRVDGQWYISRLDILPDEETCDGDATADDDSDGDATADGNSDGTAGDDSESEGT